MNELGFFCLVCEVGPGERLKVNIEPSAVVVCDLEKACVLVVSLARPVVFLGKGKWVYAYRACRRGAGVA